MLPQNRFRYFNPSAPSARIMPELPTNSAEEPENKRFTPSSLVPCASPPRRDRQTGRTPFGA